MDLILWRHAEAQLLREGRTDLERALTPKGERQAQRMAEWLNQRLAESTRVLVSPAVRTQQTAAALGRPFKTVATLAPDGTVGGLLKAARWPDAPPGRRKTPRGLSGGRLRAAGPETPCHRRAPGC